MNETPVAVAHNVFNRPIDDADRVVFLLFFFVLQVSWIRKRDLHILTFGPVSYTNDARFSVVKSASGDTWTLRIRTVQLRDAGMYECQVSSEPKISRAVRLKVVGE